MPVTGFTIRPAKKKDREEILGFLEEGDYIPKVWDKWYEDSKGKIVVGVIDDKPIAMAHYRFSDPGEVWLEGARVHPSYRKKGIATSIAFYILDEVKRVGCKVARLATSVDNIAAQKHLAKVGFNLVASYILFMTDNVSREHVSFTRKAKLDELNRLWEYLINSKVYNMFSGLFHKRWSWSRMTYDKLANMVKEHLVMVAIDNGEIKGVCTFEYVKEEDFKILDIGFLDGTPLGMTDIVKSVKNISLDKGIDKIYVPVPSANEYTELLKELGFDEVAKMYIMEKHI